VLKLRERCARRGRTCPAAQTGDDLALHRSENRRADDAALRRTQRRRKLVILAGIAAALLVLAVSHSTYPSESAFHEYLEDLGAALIVFCILGRTWASLYIGGNKRERLIGEGPYSVVRNPLYVFTVIGAAGIGFSTGSLAVGHVFAAIAFAVFHATVLSEERYLRAKFGPAFDDYAHSAPRWVPRLAAWHDADWVRARPAVIRRTFVDASLFLTALPLCETIEYLQDTGLLPVLFHVP